ncbi:DNA repair exonuclease SbcCD ATPase subunit [Staphylococcus warneri]
MNELSTEVKAQEIHERAVGFYKISEQYGYKFLMEVKTIRDEKLYKELGFENFEDYTLSNFNFDKRTINRRLQDAESFGEEYETALTSFGKHKTHQLATFPENYRNEILENGIETENGNKSIDEATTREIEKYKKQIKQRDEQNAQLQSQVEQAQRSESIARKQLEDEQNREPEVIEKYIEPEDYQQTKNALDQSRHQQKLIQQRNEKLEKDIKEMEQRRDEVSEKSQKYDELNKAINDMNAKLNDGQQRLKAQKEIYDLVKGSEKVIREVAPLCYLAFSKDIIDNDYARKPIEKIVDDLNDMANRLKKQLKQGDVIDV